jgi:hypothetical protein
MYSLFFNQIERIAIKLGETIGDMESMHCLCAAGGGRNLVLNCLKDRFIEAIPCEQQAISTGFQGGFCSARLHCGEFNDECGCSGFGLGFIFTQKSDVAPTLGTAGLSKHIL